MESSLGRVPWPREGLLVQDWMLTTRASAAYKNYTSVSILLYCSATQLLAVSLNMENIATILHAVM